MADAAPFPLSALAQARPQLNWTAVGGNNPLRGFAPMGGPVAPPSGFAPGRGTVVVPHPITGQPVTMPFAPTVPRLPGSLYGSGPNPVQPLPHPLVGFQPLSKLVL